MPNYDGKYRELFEFHSAPEVPTVPNGTVVFGRKDPLVACAFADLAGDGKSKWAIITGGVGKDSGDLNIPEAEYLAQEAERYAAERGIDLRSFYLETQATNGGENARNSFDIMLQKQLGHETLTAVAHATSLRRLAHMLDHTAVERGLQVDTIYRVPSRYEFDPSNPVDQQEVIAETKKLLDWPAKGWLQEKAAGEVPADLVDFVQDTDKAD